ncbi:MAG: restriction endonuclease subunit S [Chloroflexota bacterium]|nr:restriction endonuclease subunit S [Chloroflexota bacterium]
MSRLKFVASTNDDALSEREDPLRPVSYVDISSVDLTRGITHIEEMVFEDAPSRARRLVRDGDTIVSTVRTYLRAIAPITDPSPTMVVSTGFAVIRPRDFDPGFSGWALRAQGFVEEVVARSVGVSYPAINAPEIGNIPVAAPPLDEQRGIAAFLDRETERIDSLIAKKRLLIERLQEYRTALITRTVTRGLPPEAARAAGLDPSPRLKPSGVEWLGDVPEHWDVMPLRRLLSEPLKYGANEAGEHDDPAHPRYVRITDITDSDSLRDETFRSLPPDVAAPYLLEEGDLLLARSGATVGKSFLYRRAWGECAYAGYLIRARCQTQAVESRFVRYFTASDPYWQWLNSAFIQATIQNVSAERYSGLLLPVPPRDEQDAIVFYLDSQTRQIDFLETQVDFAIERLQEYRTALITAAVTGKIDVRDEVSVTPYRVE